MNENPYQSPEQPQGMPVVIDEPKLRKDLENAIKARKYTLLAIPLVGTMTGLQYAGIFSPGQLPNWFGLVVVAIALIQLPIVSYKISKIEAKLEKVEH